MKSSIVLCSGGIDSVTTANYVKKKLKQNPIILFFNYQQPALKQERKSSKLCAKSLKSKFIELTLPCMGYSNNNFSRVSSLKNTKNISNKFYIPARNLIFLSHAISLAEKLKIKNIYTGFKHEGREFYPDTTKEFLDSLNKVANISTKVKPKATAPFINMDKEDIINLAIKLNINLKNTFSCYLPIKNKHCGKCLACKLRKAGFYWANQKDTTQYS
jgi:7-cyano-7-deazaguanine synthase